MTINKQAFELAGVTERDYKTWCEENHKAQYKTKTKADFFARIRDGRLVKDVKTGKLVKKYHKKPMSRYDL